METIVGDLAGIVLSVCGMLATWLELRRQLSQERFRDHCIVLLVHARSEGYEVDDWRCDTDPARVAGSR